MSTGQLAGKFARYQFRPHFFQHATFRVVQPVVNMQQVSCATTHATPHRTAQAWLWRLPGCLGAVPAAGRPQYLRLPTTQIYGRQGPVAMHAYMCACGLRLCLPAEPCLHG